ncbi:hypothetical protein M8818_007178 [Zalaria obscura]|uniref:Uncharacterized protein n=1 Tax=Zalaria obscura TaxID=2024903 RepID=A0ACC3S500_9PEZI
MSNLAQDEAEVIRYAGLLRGTESAAQAVSYGLDSIDIMGQIGSVYLNFALWAVAIVPAWFVIREIGVTLHDRKIEREARQGSIVAVAGAEM